jgi:hypothetical protein
MPSPKLHRTQRLCMAISLALLSLPASAQFAAVQPLSALDGSNGFRLDGVAPGDFSGYAVSAAGDVNGDGLDDLIIGAYRADPSGYSSGSSYVVFGRSAGFAAAINLSTLDGSNGFRLDGGAVGDSSGYTVSAAGDVNGDGLDDLIIGAPGAISNSVPSGRSYVVFGSSTGFAGTIHFSSLDGGNGFRLDGVADFDRSGRAVSAAGDVNGDGLDDLIIGARAADPNGSYSGSSYVVFGRSTGFGAAINLSTLDGSNGFRLDGVSAYDLSGQDVSAAGDINGDGIDDLVIGASGADPNGSYSGTSYVVFGRSTSFAAAINLSTLDSSNGFRLDGVAIGDFSGFAVSAAGDVNGDSLDDLIIGAHRADPNGIESGRSFVVFGRNTGFAAAINLSTLNGSNGFRLDGDAAGDGSGRAVSAAGDVNGDGLDDLIIGAYGADPSGYSSGSSYVVFGRSTGFGATIHLSTLDGRNGFRLDGVTGLDRSGRAVSAAGDVNGDGIDDLIIGAPYADPKGFNSGSSYVVFGKTAPIFQDSFEAN